jgi:hypothetical protein
MVALDWRGQILFLAIFMAADLALRRKTDAHKLRFVRWIAMYWDAAFELLNVAGLFTTNLLSMSRIHAVKLLALACIYINDALSHPLCLVDWSHHAIGLAGVILQLHIGLGGGLMSFLLLDGFTWYFKHTRIYWLSFLLIRIVLYNFEIAIAVVQGRRKYSASPSVELKL